MEELRGQSRRRKVAEAMNINGNIEDLMRALKAIETERLGVDVQGPIVTIGNHSFIPWG